MGRRPLPGDDLMIPDGSGVCLDGPGNVARSLIVEGTLTKLGGETVTLEIGGNLECRGANGRVRMPNGEPLIWAPWTIRFLVASEAQFVGGSGMSVIGTDIGLWIHQGCRAELEGSPKTPWTRLRGPALAGDTVIDVEAAQNWRVGDELGIAPTDPPSVPNWYDRYDYPRIAAIVGTRITLDRPLQYPHPAVTVRPIASPARTMTAEVMNFTREGNIEGRPGACAIDNNPVLGCQALRAHIWIHNDRPSPQRITHVALRWMGPQRLLPNGDLNEWNGRYPVHFHVNGDYSNGSILDGLVLRDSGAHGPVFHDSNGIALLNTVMHGILGSAVTWDSRASGCTTCAEPRNLTIVGNITSRLRFIPAHRGALLTGYFIGAQDGHIYRGNVAVGTQGVATASGANWPEATHAVAVFDAGNVVHNTRTTCLYNWQNDARRHDIMQLIIFHCPRGIVHGAYANAYEFTDVTTAGQLGIELHAMSLEPRIGRPQRWVRFSGDAGGTPCVVRTTRHVVAPGAPVLFEASRFTNYTRAAFCLDSDGNDDWIEVDATTTVTGLLVSFGPTVTAGSRFVDRRMMQTYWRRDQSARCPTSGRLDAAANSWVCPN